MKIIKEHVDRISLSPAATRSRGYPSVLLTMKAPERLVNAAGPDRRAYLVGTDPLVIELPGVKGLYKVDPDQIVFEQEGNYQQAFKKAMKKYGISKISDLDTPEEKKGFFNYVDSIWKAKDEKSEACGWHKYGSEDVEEIDHKKALDAAAAAQSDNVDIIDVSNEEKLREEIKEIVREAGMSQSAIKKMRDKFEKTGELPPHLKKFTQDLDKLKDKYKVKDIVVPGLEWMSEADISEKAVSRAQQAAIAISKKERGEKPKKEVAPPGRKKQVKGLKKAIKKGEINKTYVDKKTGKRMKANPFALAWAQYDKHGKPNESVSENKQEMLKTMETMVRDGLGLKSLIKIEPMGSGVLGYVFSNPKEGKMIAKQFKKRGKLKKTETIAGRFVVFMTA